MPAPAERPLYAAGNTMIKSITKRGEGGGGEGGPEDNSSGWSSRSLHCNRIRTSPGSDSTHRNCLQDNSRSSVGLNKP